MGGRRKRMNGKTLSGLCLPIVMFLTAAGYSEPIRILPLGDSITHGYGTGIPSNAYNSYRKTLKNLLQSNGYPVDFVGSLTDGDFADNQHEGHDGWYADHDTKTNRIIDHASNWVANTSADMVLLHIGTNDINGNNENTTEVSAIIDAIYQANPNATIVLALIISTRPGPDSLAAEVSTYNSNVNTMAQTRIMNGDDILMVDMENGAGIDYASSDMSDRLHPSQTGYNKMATNWYPAVVEAIQRQTPAPVITDFLPTEPQLQIAISNLTINRTAHIQATPSLSNPAWIPVDSFLATTGETNRWLTHSGTGTFYRIALP